MSANAAGIAPSQPGRTRRSLGPAVARPAAPPAAARPPRCPGPDDDRRGQPAPRPPDRQEAFPAGAAGTTAPALFASVAAGDQDHPSLPDHRPQPPWPSATQVPAPARTCTSSALSITSNHGSCLAVRRCQMTSAASPCSSSASVTPRRRPSARMPTASTPGSAADTHHTSVPCCCAWAPPPAPAGSCRTRPARAAPVPAGQAPARSASSPVPAAQRQASSRCPAGAAIDTTGSGDAPARPDTRLGCRTPAQPAAPRRTRKTPAAPRGSASPPGRGHRSLVPGPPWLPNVTFCTP